MLLEIAVCVKSLRHLPQQFFHDEKERELALARGQRNGSSSSSNAYNNSNSKTTPGGASGSRVAEHRRCLRAQAIIVGVKRETGNSKWGRGVRSREATWLRGSDSLSWRIEEQQFKQVKAYSPVCKVTLPFEIPVQSTGMVFRNTIEIPLCLCLSAVCLAAVNSLVQ